MPRIADRLLDCSIYLYESSDDALTGKSCGGSGFIVGVVSELAHLPFAYAVTNSHVIREARALVLRFNTADGQYDLQKTTPEMWTHHTDGDDVAVCKVDLSDDRHKFRMVMTDEFVTKDLIKAKDIGPGDDVFMVGRFVNHEGKQRNLPTVRFGNIAQMPGEPILNRRGLLQESFLVETRSMGGCSGSPVFIHIAITPDELWMPESLRSLWPSSKRRLQPAPTVFAKAIDHTERLEYHGPWLLGIDWGHLSAYEPIFEKDQQTRVAGDLFARSNTGMAGIVPAWKILELLNTEELVMQRRSPDMKGHLPGT
jgi:hypothetical protein